MFNQHALIPHYKTRMRLSFFGLAFLLSLASSIAAQTTSTITGEVKDTNSALLVGVRITAAALETGVKRTTSSGPEGRFVFPALPVGTRSEERRVGKECRSRWSTLQ